ncbi:MAG: FAD-dependent oxidoreductase, partial [Steroidobacteraceae bacterium]
MSAASAAPLPPYPSTYYAAFTPLAPGNAPLQQTRVADVCVVGGGIAGCSAALALAERGYRVVLLEAQRLGWGASGRAGGQVIFGVSAEQDELESLVGRADAHAIWELAL